MVRSLGSLLLMSISLVACSATEFAAKEGALSKTSVFGTGDSTGTITQPGDSNNGGSSSGYIPGLGGTNGSGGGSGSTSGNNITAVGILNLIKNYEPPPPAPDKEDVTITLLCSDSRSQSSTNLKKAIAKKLSVQLSVGSESCTTDAQVILNLVRKDKITRADLEKICPNILPAAGAGLSVTVTVDGTATKSAGGLLTLLYARNTDTSVASEAADQYCDQKSSPLVIHMASNVRKPRPIALSAPQDGVDFDLLGASNDHMPVRISWFTNDDYRFLALPDANGEVHGIDQLFGNNTTGPDGTFASDGYAALSKFDGTSADGSWKLAAADGMIDARDPIFSRLRLWLDTNRDGIGQANEMVSLQSAGLAYIDLTYSTRYGEVDAYGNETKMKSVVGYRDGSLDLIFDLWFRVDFN